MKAQQVVCVLGMHRSGTSMLTRILNLLGVYLGPDERLLAPSSDNPKGYWEHRGFIHLNDRILAWGGGSHSRPPTFPPGWATAPDLEELRQSALAMIHRDFAGAQKWGWKDPRTCLTLPFWQYLFPSMRFILCFRSPLEVVRSLQHRDKVSFARGVYLWLTYACSILEGTADRPRCITCYEDLLGDCQGETRALASFVESEPLLGQPEVQRAVSAFIDKDLRHHHSRPHPPERQGKLGHAEQALDLACRGYAGLRKDRASSLAVEGLLRDGLSLLAPAICRELEQEDAWNNKMAKANEELLSLIGTATPFILVDQDQLRYEMSVGRYAYPFLEHAGQYWGNPEDNEVAVRELERLRRNGAAFIVFAWPALWWLDYYAGLHRYLHSSFRCILYNDRLVVFDLRTHA